MATKHAKSRPADSKQKLQRQYSLFAYLWALSSLLWSFPRLLDGWSDAPIAFGIDVAICASAFAILLRPTWNGPLAGCALLHAANGIVMMPYVGAAYLLWMCCGAAIVVSAVAPGLRRSRLVHPTQAFARFAPSLRVMMLLAIVALTFTRMNWNFVSTQSSSVVNCLTSIIDTAPPTWGVYLVMSALLVIDFAVAFCLSLPHQRHFGIGLGSCSFAIQGWLGLGETNDLLPLLCTGLYLFATPELAARINRFSGQWMGPQAIRRAAIPFVTVLVIGVALSIETGSIETSESSTATQVTSQQVLSYAHLSFVTGWLLLLGVGLSSKQPQLSWAPMMIRNPLHLAIVAFLLLAAASPFLGLGTWGLFLRDSGLVTEGGTNNHMILPQTYVAPFQTDLVRVTSADAPELQELIDSQLVIPRFELERFKMAHPNVSFTFTSTGGDADTPAEGEGKRFESNIWILHKLLAFRTLSLDSLTSRSPG